MATQFNANQYEDAYRPWRLGVWEVARSIPERPRPRKGRTRIIADDRGHLLKASLKTPGSPWGPLAQQLDFNANHEENDEKKLKSGSKGNLTKEEQCQRKERENIHEEETEKEDKAKKHLKVTGAGFAGPSNQSTRHETESDATSGTITPASFRKVSRTATPFIRSPRSSLPKTKSSASTSAAHGTPVKLTSSGAVNSKQESHKKIIEEASKLPSDTIEDALLPRKPEDILDGNTRALAIRLVEHPGATNCTKYTVLRPYTAPSPVSDIPLLAKRPKTSKTITTIPEIEYALKWDLHDRIAENETIINLKENTKKSKVKDPQTPRSVASTNSDDSGINIPKRAWEENCPDTKELTKKLESLKNCQGSYHCRNKNKRHSDPESGYGTPASNMTKESLPSVTPDKSSGRSNNPGTGKNITRSVSNLSSLKSNSKQSEKISIDAKCLSAKACNSHNRCPPNNSRSLSKASHSSSNRSKPRSAANPLSGETIRSPTPPPQRNPLEIMETLDSVFHKVPLRDTFGGGYGYPSLCNEVKEKKVITSATQTDPRSKTLDQSTTTHKEKLKQKQDLKARNCVACEVRGLDEPSKKYLNGSETRQPFRFGKPDKRFPNRPRYVRQSERYQAKMKGHREAPRFWPINTLSSPFNNRQGYGQDQYPNHMRLRTTYQMAHQNNEKPQHVPLIKKLYK